MNLLSGIGSTSGALAAEKTRMNIVAQNIANANTTRDADGQAYQRKVVTFESFLDPKAAGRGGAGLSGVRVASVDEDPSPPRLVYDPSHPDADENGMVTLPNVDTAREMVDLIASSRAYEANLQVARAARQMAKQTLQMGR